MQIFKAHNYEDSDLFWDSRKVGQFDVQFFVIASEYKPVNLSINFQAAIANRMLTTEAVAFSLSAGLRGPVYHPNEFSNDSYNPKPEVFPIEGAQCAKNIVNQAQHYEQAVFSGLYAIKTTGWYRVEVWATSRSDAVPEFTNGLTEIHFEPNTLNQIIVVVDD